MTMAANQARGVSASRVALNTTACSNIKGTFLRYRTMCSSAKPRCMPLRQGPTSISAFSGSSLECASTRRFNIAADITRVRSGTELEFPSLVDEGKNAQAPTSETIVLSPVSTFMMDLVNLIKFVDARDIVELELKFQEYEIIIRKEAALPPAIFLEPLAVPQSPFLEYTTPPVSTPAPPSVPVTAILPPPSVPQRPPMLSPMAGTFYRSPGRGESPFVKVGDQVVKGQVVCIIEAMKLMNEIEADQSGTIDEILAEDGKPVSMESTLFSIKP